MKNFGFRSLRRPYGRIADVGFLSIVILAVLATLVGCTGASAVPGGTCFASYAAPDGTRVTWQNDKDTSADSISFDPRNRGADHHQA